MQGKETQRTVTLSIRLEHEEQGERIGGIEWTEEEKEDEEVEEEEEEE